MLIQLLLNTWLIVISGYQPTFEPIAHERWSVTVADNYNIWVHGRGDTLIDRYINGVYVHGILKNVIYIPEIGRNLFSVGLVFEVGTSFYSEIPDRLGYCEFRAKNGVKVLESKRVNRLYPLDFKVILPSTLNIVTTSSLPSKTYDIPKSQLQDLMVWHQRMGHVNISTIQHMNRIASFSDFHLKNCSVPKTLYSGCLLGKQHKAVYKVNPQKTRVQKPRIFLHGDISGKMGTLSINGN